MNSLIIVDDEHLSRYALRTLITKKICSVEIVGEAENGRQAVEMNRKLRPDIIIMDIKMPGLNGIEASMEILGEFPEANILILTAYDNFDYIKRALDIGVKGYILKPVKELEVVEKIEKVQHQINEKANQCDFKEIVESKIRIVKPFMEDELVSAFITGSCNAGKVENYISFLQEDIKAGYFILISAAGYSYSNEINDSIRNRIIKEKIMSILTRHLPLLKKCFFGKTQGNSAVVFIPVDMKLPSSEVVKEAVMIGQEAKRKLKVIGDIDAAVGIGNVYTDIMDFCKSYNEAAAALRTAAGDRSVIHFGALNCKAATIKSREYPFELEAKLTEQLKIGNIGNARGYADEILAYILENYNSPEVLKEYAGEFVAVLKRTVLKMGPICGNPMNEGLLSELSALSSVDEIDVWLRRAVCNILEMTERGAGRNIDVIGRVFDYTNRNFNRNITLESVAAEVGLTPQYLSKIFKEKCGTNFIDYITQKRLEYAEELLKKGTGNIKDISRMSGYEDSNYFCKLFKKETGLSPKQYRTKVTMGD